MANALFTQYKVDLIEADVDLIADNVKVVLVDHGTDTPNASTDDFLDDIGAGARVATSGNLASKTAYGGAFDAADITINAVSGASFESLVVYDDTPGAESAKNLCVLIDTATGLPATPSGGNITIQWHSSGIYSL